MTQPDTKNDRELAEHAVLRTVAQGDQFSQGGTVFFLAATLGPGGPLLVGDRILRDRPVNCSVCSYTE